MSNPLWRYEMELPQRNDFDNEEDYDYAMNLWAHDRLYGWEDDLSAYEREQEYERELIDKGTEFYYD